MVDGRKHRRFRCRGTETAQKRNDVEAERHGNGQEGHMKHFLRKTGRWLWNLGKLTVIAGLLLLSGLGIHAYCTYGDTIQALRQEAVRIAEASRAEDFQTGQTSVLYDASGERIASLRSGRDSYYLTYEELPREALDAMLVTEDRKFYAHGGVDYLANLRAAIALLRHHGEITQGASTITQQLARTVYLTYEVTYDRKIEEIFLAWELEKKYSKQEILEFYMNNIYFANGYYGLQAAAYGYFGKSAKELDLSELVFLCAIPNSPSRYDPYTGYEVTIERRNRMLLQMKEYGRLSEEEYQSAKEARPQLKQQTVTKHNYVETYAKYCAVRALMRLDGFSFQTEFPSEEEKTAYEKRYEAAYEYWQKQMYLGGYRIYTSLDLTLQQKLQQAVNQGTEEFTEVNEEGIYELQASAVCIDNATGLIVAIVGGREQEYPGYTWNRAYQSFRQPGSAIKPLLIYTPMFERGLSPEDIVLDEKEPGGPVNSGGVYSGEITVRYAVERSKNTIAWKLLEELTPTVGLSYLRAMGFRRIVATDEVPAAALGGFTYGASVLEMTGAYAALCNDGVFRTPDCILRITDGNGTDIYQAGETGKRIYETNASRVMTEVLKGVLTSGTARKSQLETAIAAGKTGTTNDKKDGWFIGYTAYYTTGVWIGRDLPKRIETLSGSTYPAAIWKSYMDAIHEGLPVREFPEATPIPQTRFSVKAVLTPEVTPTPTLPLEAAEDGSKYQVTPTPAGLPGGEEPFDPTEDPEL